MVGVLVLFVKTVAPFVEGLLTCFVGTTLRAFGGTLVGNLVGFLVENHESKCLVFWRSLVGLL